MTPLQTSMAERNKSKKRIFLEVLKLTALGISIVGLSIYVLVILRN